MSLSLNNIYQRPYMNPNGRNFVKKREDGEKSPSAELQKESQNQNSRSKGLQYQEQKPSSYTPAYNQTFSIPNYDNVNIHRRNVSTQNVAVQSVQQQAAPSINNNINIAQILLDLKNTSLAIGAPDNISQDVNMYISLVENQVKHENPNIDVVVSNLKNAATLLDGYISQTLNKNSKVVYNWIDTIFLQKVDFNYDENSVNEGLLLKFPDGSTSQTRKAQEEALKASELASNEEKVLAPVNERVLATPMSQDKYQIVPLDEELKKLFLKGKRLAFAKKAEKAIPAFAKALDRASEIGDNDTAGKIYYEVGKIYDDNDYLPQALKSYNQSVILSKDNNVKTKAHYSMAQIYDDVNQITPALDHYYSAISYAGESENLPAQSASLTKIGNIHTAMYDKDAFDFYDLAQGLADQTEDYKLRGFVDSNTGKAYQQFDEGEMALKSFSYATQNYLKAQSPNNVAKSYLAAADLMVEFGKFEKAKNLLNKSMKFAAKSDNTILINEINTKLKQLTSIAA